VTSAHLQEIIDRHHQIANVQVVFVDIVDYSKRRTQSQVSVIGAFTKALKAALKTLSQRYVEYSQANDINFATDVVVIPTGDGAAIGFTFDGLHDIHLNFAQDLLNLAYDQKAESPCERFTDDGWCNCHDYFNLRTGIADGKAVVFKDVNDNYNLAGGVVNTAARIMGKMDPNQIGMSMSAYEQFIDLNDDPNIADRFEIFDNIRIKHGLKISIAQFRDPDQRGLDSDPAREMTMTLEGDAIVERVRGLMVSALGPSDDESTEVALARLKIVEGAVKAMQGGRVITPVNPGAIGEALQQLGSALSPPMEPAKELPNTDESGPANE
jgi:class 3 adenylate cyclase